MYKPIPKVTIIGAGISGLSAAIDLASYGFEVSIYEKNSTHGGRGRCIDWNGFRFDMGPSWYWMPDIFESFFQKHNSSVKDYFNLIRLDPSYRIFFKDEQLDSSADINKIYELFESHEKGSSTWLKKFLKDAQLKYEIGMKQFVRKPSLSFFEYLDIRLFVQALNLNLTSSINSVIRRNIKNEKLRNWLEFPILFLGAKPSDTPSLYSLMNYADLVLGTWYPEGGMIKLFDALLELAKKKGVKFYFNSEVEKINIKDNKATTIKLKSSTEEILMDYIVSSADYHHTDTNLLDKSYRQYSDAYWESRALAPSSLIFYIGVNKKLDGLLHHNLFFDTDFNQHAKEIYDRKTWPENPLFYVSVTSKTDPTVAPEGHENLFILIPLAPGIEDTDERRNKLFEQVISRIEKRCQIEFEKDIILKKSYAIKDFIKDYNSFKGNAYGLSNILSQTAFLKPKLKHKKISNLFFAGQLTHPGPGLPPSLISGEIVAQLIQKDFK